MILFVKSEGPDQTAQMRGLILAFAVRIRPNIRFRMTRPICNSFRLYFLLLPN